MEVCYICGGVAELVDGEGRDVCLDCFIEPVMEPGEPGKIYRPVKTAVDVSLIAAFVPPEHGDSCGCGCGDFGRSFTGQLTAGGLEVEGVKDPSLFELDLARRPHRWKEVRDITADFLGSVLKAVTAFERELLEAAGLPDIEAVREAFGKAPDAIRRDGMLPDGDGMKGIADDTLKRILASLIDAIAGSGGDYELSGLPIYPHAMLASFAVGLDKTRKEIERASDNPELLPAAVTADWGNAYLRKLTAEGLKRIKTRIARDYRKEIERILREGAAEGLNPLKIATRLHRAVGEGQMWYWNRLARSEISIALDAAFVAEAKNDGILYERWSTSANPCPICAPYDGKIWRVGEGPRVVYDTHPHCLCVKYPYTGTPERVGEAHDHGNFAYI